MLAGVEWGEYRLGDLFEILSSKKRFDANKVVIGDKGHPYVVRTSQNNGIRGFIEADESYLNDGNTISFGQDTATMYYQPTPYFTGDKIKVLRPKFEQFTSRNAQFFISCLKKPFMSFSWGASSFNVKALAQQVIQLPTCNSEIDYEFMERFIAELNAARLAELNAYLTITGLKDYTLTPEEEQAVKDFEEGKDEWGEFDVTRVFEVRNAGNILASEIVEGSGSTPYLCASRENNAVSSYISYKEDLITEGNCVFIGGKTFVVTYQEQDFFSNDSHNLTLRLYALEHQTKSKQLYLATCVDKSLRYKYSWGDSVSNRKIQRDNIYLPSVNGEVDFSKMETFISAIQKLVIKDVVLYADREIEATKRVIDKTSKSKVVSQKGSITKSV